MLGALFALLALGFAGVAAAAVRDAGGVRGWVIGLAAAALAFWLAGLSARVLRAR